MLSFSISYSDSKCPYFMDTTGREWIGGERRAKDRVKTE
jgi:ribosome modulation factor